MSKAKHALPASHKGGSGSWIARDGKSGKSIEVHGNKGNVIEGKPGATVAATANAAVRRPGRFKGVLIVGPEFFEPLSDSELMEFQPQ